ncbi:MAG: SpoIIE family protein phosphatase [Lachnospiraceae bacterium]|nr:SpoIIE family protein phosphatase [Lachnospiraceae bacterium]
MQFKLNALVIGNILAVALGLMLISYYVFCQRVDDKYNDSLDRAAEACANNVEAEVIEFFWNAVNTDEFREVQARAEAAGDEQIIIDWMQSKQGLFADEEDVVDAEGETRQPEKERWTLYDDYQLINNSLQAIEEFFEVDSAYYQVYADGNTYNIADPKENLFYIATVEAPIEEFEDYPGNVEVPPLVYHSEFGWLLTVIKPIVNLETGEAVATAAVDLNMTDIIRERYAFVQQSLIFVAVLLVLAIGSSIVLMQRTAIRPLRQLAEAATRFAKEDRAFTKEDVIQLDLHSNDEVSDLYREIQAMENRIVDYTDHLTQVTAEKERVSTELRTASQIQESMLPSIFPAFPDRDDFDLYASMTPAKEVGGDFYDFFLIDDSHLAVLIADVSDKGVPAALFMMSAKILINYRAQLGGGPSEILSAVNAEICKSNKSRMFVTVWLGILNLETGVLTCTNAGHEYPFVRGQDGVFRVYKDRHGMVVGALARSKYKDYEIQMMPGDAIFVYTDGVPEANNAEGAFYGMERLEEALNRIPNHEPQHILQGIKADVDAFTGEASQFDDLTMLCLEYKGRSRT